MKSRSVVIVALVLTHLGLGVLGVLLHSQFLADMIGGSVYWPLAPFDALGLPVFQLKGWWLPDVTPAGWGVVIALWVAIYWVIADVLVRLVGKRRRVA